MRTFVPLTKLARRDASITEIGTKMHDRDRSGRAWLEELKKNCPEINFKAHYALMGYWDSMHIYEAPDEETAAKVSLLTRNYAAQVESWVALPYDMILKLTEEIESQKQAGKS
ncbi:MAG TPA: GYD domain-containing protein [Terriglobales bacterium]|nr:GYD domain-containing protein [Terriglobales bacterium]